MGSKKNKKAKEAAKAESPNLAAVKTELTIARDNFKTFLTKNELERNKDYSTDKKFGKEYTKLSNAINELTTAKAELEVETKSKKKSVASSRTKYDYPAGVTTAEQKKKYRVEQRSAAKKASKVAAKEESKGSSKADKKSKAKEVVVEVEKPIEKPAKKKSKTPKED